MRIDVIFDTICPWCYIGKRRLEEALERKPLLNAEITWHAFLLNPEMPPDGMAYQEYLNVKFGGSARADRVYNTIKKTGQSVGIDFDFETLNRTPNTIDSHRIVRYATRHGRAGDMVEALFHSYFFRAIDIGNRSALISIAGNLGLDEEQARAYLYSDEDIHDIQNQNARAHRLGISGVPAFIVDNNYSIAGAQEPMVLARLIDVAEEKERELFGDGSHES